jgi:hypothetical protein
MKLMIAGDLEETLANEPSCFDFDNDDAGADDEDDDSTPAGDAPAPSSLKGPSRARSPAERERGARFFTELRQRKKDEECIAWLLRQGAVIKSSDEQPIALAPHSALYVDMKQTYINLLARGQLSFFSSTGLTRSARHPVGPPPAPSPSTAAADEPGRAADGTSGSAPAATPTAVPPAKGLVRLGQKPRLALKDAVASYLGDAAPPAAGSDHSSSDSAAVGAGTKKRQRKRNRRGGKQRMKGMLPLQEDVPPAPSPVSVRDTEKKPTVAQTIGQATQSIASMMRRRT